MISIIVPICNRAGNLPELIMAIRDSLNEAEHDVIIVDGSSSDGVGELADGLAKEYGNIRVIHRGKKLGVDSAIAEGVKETRGEVICTINADMLQAPTLLPAMLGQMGEHDIVVASRYVAGGHSEKGFWHRLVSGGARIIVRFVHPKIRNIKDPLSGLFLFKRDVIAQAQIRQPPSENVSVVVKFLPELLVKGYHNSVIEVPYTEEKRKSRESKFALRDYFIYLAYVLHLMMISGELKRIVKFVIVGLTGMGVNMGVLYLLTDKLGLYYIISAAFSWETSIISMFTMHELWTFRDLRGSGSSNVLRRLLKFNTIRLINPVISLAILSCLTELFGLHYLISNMIAILTVMIWNYLTSLNIVWRK